MGSLWEYINICYLYNTEKINNIAIIVFIIYALLV